MKKEVSMSIIRLIVASLLLINAILTAKGINPIPFDESTFTEIATQIAAGIGCIWVWWKNNNVTKSAQYAQESLKVLKEKHVDDGEAGVNESDEDIETEE